LSVIVLVCECARVGWGGMGGWDGMTGTSAAGAVTKNASERHANVGDWKKKTE
jgi:hypothetical protein